jgi:hypothetical protein
MTGDSLRRHRLDFHLHLFALAEDVVEIFQGFSEIAAVAPSSLVASDFMALR